MASLACQSFISSPVKFRSDHSTTTTQMRKRSNTTRFKDQPQTNKQARRDSNISFSEGATPIHAGLGEQFSLATLHQSADVADGSSSSPSTNREEYAFTGSNSASSSSVQVCEYISAPATCVSREFYFRRRAKTQKSLDQLAKGRKATLESVGRVIVLPLVPLAVDIMLSAQSRRHPQQTAHYSVSETHELHPQIQSLTSSFLLQMLKL